MRIKGVWAKDVLFAGRRLLKSGNVSSETTPELMDMRRWNFEGKNKETLVVEAPALPPARSF